MPFTFSHPAAGLPFVRRAARYGATSALMIGTVVPDLPYFLPWPRAPYGTHSMFGLLTFCLPTGVLAALVFEHVLRAPFVALLPASWRRSVEARRMGCSKTVRFLAAAVAVLVGGSTHVLWDTLTDPDDILLAGSTWPRYNLGIIGGYHLFVYRLLKHLGTLAGALALAWALRGWYRRQPCSAAPFDMSADERSRLTRVGVTVGLFVAAGMYASSQVALPPEWLQAFRYFLRRSVIWSGRIGTVVACLYAGLWWARRLDLTGRSRTGRAGSVGVVDDAR